MPKMRPHEINSSGVKEVSRARQSKKEVLSEMPCDILNKRSSTRRNAKSCGQDTEAQQQWPFPTKVLEDKGRPLKFNPDNFEKASF